ncbi:MAG: hypothetical protein KAI24_09430, partial [Planctomycetes bacterium]|nr:hypothetical protein [Planctomycetota bacterium]
MNGPSSQVLAHAAAVVARCLEGGRGPADAMSAMPALRAAGGPVRAEVSRWARRAIAGRLRFEYLLRDRLAARSADRARLLLCAAVIEAGLDVPPGEALPSRARMQAVLEQIEEPVERLAVRAAVPRWLAERFAQTFGDEAEAVLDGLAQEAPRTVRANLLRGSRDELQARLRAEGIRTVPGRFAPTALHCEGTADLFATQAFRDGWFEQQDEASQLCVTATA